MTLNSYLLICGIHGIVQSVILFSAGGRTNKANKYLGFYILAFSIILIENPLKTVDGAVHLPNFISLPFLFSGFTLYLYSKVLSSQEVPKKEISIHAIPFLSFLFVFIWNYIADLTEFIPKLVSSTPYVNTIVFNLLGVTHMVTYLIFTKRMLRNFGDGSGTSMKISWISFLVSISLVVCAIAIVMVGAIIVVREDFNINWAYIIWIIMSFLIYAIGYAGLRKPELFQKTASQTLEDLSSTFVKYRNTRVLDSEIDEAVRKIDSLMQQELLYKQNDLNLAKLAQRIGVRSNILSRMINQHYKMNFTQLINEYRLKEVQKMLINPEYDKYSILGIAFEAGFKSKSSFNSYFNKRLKQTPKDYRAQMRKISPNLVS